MTRTTEVSEEDMVPGEILTPRGSLQSNSLPSSMRELIVVLDGTIEIQAWLLQQLAEQPPTAPARPARWQPWLALGGAALVASGVVVAITSAIRLLLAIFPLVGQ